MKRIFLIVLMVAGYSWAGNLTYTTAEVQTILDGTNNFIQLVTTNATRDWSAGQLSYDTNTMTTLADTGIEDVRVNIGQEHYIRVYNASGSTISNGYAVSVLGDTNGVLAGYLADVSTPPFNGNIIGLATHDIPDATFGFVTTFGTVGDLDTTVYPTQPIYASTNGLLTSTKPLYPSTIVVIGAVSCTDAINGVIQVDTTRYTPNSLTESYGFTSQGISAGTYWKAGFYDWAGADATLDEGLTNITYGTAGRAYAAHVGIVTDGLAVVEGGTVGMRVFGIQDMETGVQVADQYGIITTDITTLTADVMYECSEKFSGDIEIQLYTTSGSPTTYSIDFNYGYSKYSDFENRDFTITGFECEWQGNGNDSLFDVALMKHDPNGWTYAATGFLAGNGDICRKTIDQALAGDVNNNEDGAYKRVSLNEYIAGEGSEGYLIQVITGGNNTIQTMDMHIRAVSEELTR